MDLAAKQVEALKLKQQVLAEVGLSEARTEVEKLAKVAQDARKRGTESKKRGAEAPIPMRRSSR